MAGIFAIQVKIDILSKKCQDIVDQDFVFLSV